jgi:hypothetical protein
VADMRFLVRVASDLSQLGFIRPLTVDFRLHQEQLRGSLGTYPASQTRVH